MPRPPKRNRTKKNDKWFEPRRLRRLCSLIIRVTVVPRRTVVGDIDLRRLEALLHCNFSCNLSRNTAQRPKTFPLQVLDKLHSVTASLRINY